MKFPKWAPDEIVSYYIQLKDENDLNSYASMLSRLLTRPEMEKVWGWFEKQEMLFSYTQNGGLIGRFFRDIDEYNFHVKIPDSERKILKVFQSTQKNYLSYLKNMSMSTKPLIEA